MPELKTLGRLLGIQECIDARSSRDVRRCLDTVIDRVRRLVGSPEHDPLTCAALCVQELIAEYKTVKNLNQASTEITSALFTLGDSPITVEEARERIPQLRRFVRHVAYVQEQKAYTWFSALHLARIFYALYVVDRFIKCLRRCNVTELRKYIEAFVDALAVSDEDKDTLRQLLLAVLEQG